MEFSFSELRTKEVVNTQDGRRLGRVCDVALCYPENRWLGIIVPGSRGFGKKRSDLFIDLRSIVKIGEDVILVNVGSSRRACGGKIQGGNCDRGFGAPRERNYEEFE